MDGSNYDPHREIVLAPQGWATRLEARRAVLLMLGVAAVTFGTVVGLQAAGVEFAASKLYVQGE